MSDHPIAAVLAIVAVLLAILAYGVDAGYLAITTVDNLTATELAFLTATDIILAVAAYFYEDRTRRRWDDD